LIGGTKFTIFALHYLEKSSGFIATRLQQNENNTVAIDDKKMRF